MAKEKLVPKISVITSVKNCVNTLEKAIQSLLEQNYPNIEYIVIDGNSTDGTIEIIKKYQKYITYWHSEKDDGICDSYLKGLAKTTGDIISFLNADDFYEPGILNKIVEVFNTDDSLDIVSSCARTITYDKASDQYKEIDRSSPEDMILSKDRAIQIVAPCARFLKRDLYFKYGPLLLKDDKNRDFVSNDLEFFIRLIFVGFKHKIIDVIGYNYLSHENSTTFSSNPQNKARLYEDKIFIAKRFLNEKNLVVPDFWKKRFKKWIKKYRAKLIKIHLKSGNFKQAAQEFNIGTKENNFFGFTFYLFKTIVRNSNVRTSKN